MVRNTVSRRGFLPSLIPALLQPALRTQGVMAALSQETSGRQIILIFLKGGPSHIDMLDPKPDAPSTIRGEFEVIQTSLPGLGVCEYLPQLAAQLDQCTLLRGFAHTITDHDIGTQYVLTGDRSSSQETPVLGSLVARDNGWQIPPPFVAIDHSPVGAESLGHKWDPFLLNADASAMVRRVTGRGAVSPSGNQSDRSRLLEAINRASAEADRLQRNDAGYTESYHRAAEILQSDQFRRAVDLESESLTARAAYGETRFGRRLLTARRLVEAGSRFVTVMFPGWDTHFANFKRMRKLLPEFDSAISALITEQGQRDGLSNTSVIVMGEFGRSPTVSSNAGRGHWARASSVLCCGAGFRQGYVHGQTDASGAEPVSGRVSPEDLAQTMFRLAQVDSAATPLSDGRRIAATGRVIQEILEPAD